MYTFLFSIFSLSVVCALFCMYRGTPFVRMYRGPPLCTELEGLVNNVHFSMLSEQLGMLGAMKGPFAARCIRIHNMYQCLYVPTHVQYVCR